MNPDDLRAIAEKATPGMWHVDGFSTDRVIAQVGDLTKTGALREWRHIAKCEDDEFKNDNWAADAAHIAAFNPSTCLALLDELDGLKARVESAEKVLRQADAAISRAHAETRSMEDADLFEQVRIAASAHFTKHPEGKI